MPFWLRRIRTLIYLFSLALALGIFVYVTRAYPPSVLREIRLGQAYGFTAVTFLYLALLASPLYSVLPNLPSKALHITARKALGVSAFFFALLHAAIIFFFLLGGFSGLAFLSWNYLLALILSFTALLILSVLAVTSWQKLIIRLGRHWKTVHRFVYLAGVLIIIHALMLGTHFADLSRIVPQISFVALSALFLLEAVRLDRFAVKRFAHHPRYMCTITVLVIVILLAVASVFHLGDMWTLNIHAH